MTRAQSAHLKKTFLASFRQHGNITLACRESGAPRREVYRWQEHDTAFSLAYKTAEIEATEHLEAEAHRRAVQGVERLKFYEGEPLVDPETKEFYREREFSDTLLIFLLKSRAPEKYRERHDITSGGQPLQAAHADLDAAIERRLARLAAGSEGPPPLAPQRARHAEDAAR